MIARLMGTLIEKQSPDLLVDVGGVGYEVQAPMTTIFKLPAVGEQVLLYTHFVVREDAQLLFGFHSKAERGVFRVLIKVNGVGPKMAIAIMSGLELDQLANAVAQKDITMLVKVPGVGKKTAERLIVELADKLDQASIGPLFDQDLAMQPSADDALEDAQSALVALGYTLAQAKKAVKAVAAPGQTSDELIRLALRQM